MKGLERSDVHLSVCILFTFYVTYEPLVIKHMRNNTFAVNYNQSHELLTNTKEAIHGLVCHHLVCE